MRYLIPLLVFSLLVISCGDTSPVSPDESQSGDERAANLFNDAQEIFSGTNIEPTIDADVSEILSGPGSIAPNTIGTPWENAIGRHSTWRVYRFRHVRTRN